MVSADYLKYNLGTYRFALQQRNKGNEKHPRMNYESPED